MTIRYAEIVTWIAAMVLIPDSARAPQEFESREQELAWDDDRILSRNIGHICRI